MLLTTRRHLLLVALLVLGCGLSAIPARAADGAQQKYPDVLGAMVQPRGGEVFDFDVTVSSPYDTPQRYADAFRVTGNDGSVYAERVLLHDHADEQPFTRDLHGVRIPRGERRVIIQARDRKFGYGGRSVALVLPGR